MKDGVIADFDITQSMLKYFIHKAIGFHSLVRPRIVVGVPSGVTEVEKRAVVDAAIQAGAREAYLIEEPMAAAIGAGLPVQEATGSMVVDIGGGTCEVAVISLGGIVVSRSIRTGGDAIDDAISRYIRKTFSLLIGERTAEQIKITLANQVCTGIAEPVANIVDAVRNTLERTPPELASDIIDHGIIMTGGSSLLRNLDKLISRETGMPVYVSDEALACVVLGTVWKILIPIRKVLWLPAASCKNKVGKTARCVLQRCVADWMTDYEKTAVCDNAGSAGPLCLHDTGGASAMALPAGECGCEYCVAAC